MGLKKLHLYLIKPSRYDDDGYVVRHWRGVLPSNTLACLAGLTEDVVDRKLLGESLDVKIHLIDETVQRVPVKRICRSQRGDEVKTIVGLVGVQTNQFPRAADLALEMSKAGVTVLLGGFHVSGVSTDPTHMPQDMQQLLDAGVTIVRGEVEETWGGLLLDAVQNRLKPLYDFLNDKPDLHERPLPAIRKEYLRRFASKNFGTLDCGRGCPFECSFCTIITIQGRKMRFRSAEQIAETVRSNYHHEGISFYFFTDDNFARNKNWEPIFDALIRLREEEEIAIEFMMQVDVLSWKIDRFIKKARQAGCINVFIGMESLNTDSLLSSGKRQNNVAEYGQLIDAYHQEDITCHVGYIIGFPTDTVDSVRSDLDRLIQDVRPDHASFFMMMPLPGSKDYSEMVRLNEWMDPDLNDYDSDHEVTAHPNLKDGDWKKLYLEAWRTFYSFENMKATLKNTPPCNYWNNFIRFIWYKNSIQTEERHPMMCGWFRLKGRKMRRPGYPILSRWKYYTARTREVWAHVRSMARILLEMEELWLQTRHPSLAEQRIVEELNKIRVTARGHLRIADQQAAHLRAKMRFPTIHVPSKLRLLWTRWYPIFSHNKVYTRADLASFWSTATGNWKARRWFRIPPHLVFVNVFRDAQLSFLFFFHLIRSV